MGLLNPVFFFPYIYLYLLLKVTVTFIRSHILAALLWKIRAFWKNIGTNILNLLVPERGGVVILENISDYLPIDVS